MLPENNIDYIHIVIGFNGSQTLFFAGQLNGLSSGFDDEGNL